MSCIVMFRASLVLAVCLLPGLLAGAVPPVQSPVSKPAPARQQGIGVDLSITPAGALKEGDEAVLRFRVSDTNTGTPLSGVFPAAWMDLLVPGLETSARSCEKKVEDFVGGGLLARPEVDLNTYYVLTLNDDATVAVVDPLFHFGGSRLIDMIFLKSPGEDWALTADGKRLFISQPDVGEVAVADTGTWRVISALVSGPRPRRLALQPDQGYLWVTWDGGVDVFDPRSLTRVAHLLTGRGTHDLAFSDDSRFAFVTNRGDGTLSVLDVRTLAKLRDVRTGPQPVSVAYSGQGRAAWVSDAGDGTLVAISPEKAEPAAKIVAEPGLGQIAFAPGGRYGFVVNPKVDKVHILDAAQNRIVQTAHVEPGPDAVAFSAELAYIRHRDSETVLTIPLGAIGREGAAVPVVDFPGGQTPFGKGRRPSVAAGILRAPGAQAVLVANPADEAVYYYKEGMAAPMGSFSTEGHQPRAVLVLDRSLKEAAPGEFETTVKLRRPGRYDVAFFLDSPRLVHCFEVTVAVNPELERRRRSALGARVDYLVASRKLAVGRPSAVRFRLTDPVTGAPQARAADVTVLSYQPPGTRQKRQPAREVEPGVYEIRLTPADPGVYYVFVQSLSLGLQLRNSPPLILQAVAAATEGGSE